MTKTEYIQALKWRKEHLKNRIMVDRHDNKFVEPNDRRYREFQLIKRILRLHRGS
jgi:hypothetical protein